MLSVDAILDPNHAMLQRYLNGRFVSFDVDKLLPVFEPFHQGITDRDGTVPLRFPGFPDNYELRLGADAVDLRVTLTLDIRLPIHAPGFWFCIHCLMAEDFVALLAPSTRGIYYVNPNTPDHAPTFDADTEPTFASTMTRIQSVNELIRLFVVPDNGG
ncbi:hypothetical protein [Novipirellula sp.]|uniref:hypothetical protein n=1 Tax=Novipirellula sp. TaxID=2795430 RepID=UPI003565158F